MSGSYISRILMLSLIAAFGSACSTFGTDMNRAKDNIILQFRKPGEQMILPPKTVWKKNSCANLELPRIVIEQYQVVPGSGKAGSSFSQRLIYSLCSNQRGDEISGDLHTKIFFRGKAIKADTDSNYYIKPGKWCVDRIIDIPPEASPGVYLIEMEFRSAKLQFKEYENFVVLE